MLAKFGGPAGFAAATWPRAESNPGRIPGWSDLDVATGRGHTDRCDDAHRDHRHRSFRDAGALAVYAGVAPRTHRSGTSVKGEHRQHSGNARLKRAKYLSAFAALKDPISRADYDRKRAEGRRGWCASRGQSSRAGCRIGENPNVAAAIANTTTTPSRVRRSPIAPTSRPAITAPSAAMVRLTERRAAFTRPRSSSGVSVCQ
ncbi:hypothetical protein BS618_05635 [Rhodococcus erythropolis]|nr:hypothetical protein BS618_05635 [Rhodococcus erythropolis]